MDKQDSENKKDKNLLELLLKDPTISTNNLAKKLGINRQTIWRKKKQLEKDNLIWGYTTVINEDKLKHVLYLALFKAKPLTKELIDTLRKRIERRQTEEDVHIINLLYLAGEYDFSLLFSAPDHITARRFYESLRIIYKNFLFEKPILLTIDFSIIRDGKVNPELQKFYNFVPRI